MDNADDPTVVFDNKGRCSYCIRAYREMPAVYFPNDEGKRRLDALLAKVREEGRKKKYDCIMGISGGLDSSYLAYLGYTWGLRVFAVHVDDGFDTEISKSNISRLIDRTGFDYEVITPDPTQYNALIKAYLKAGVPNITAPQDNVLFAFLYDKMKRNKIKYFLSGGNFALESIVMQGNSHSASDVINIKDIAERFDPEPIDRLRFISSARRQINDRLLGIKSPRPLNYIDYNRERAFAELADFCGFEYYGRKHLENILTAFVQLYWLPVKFGADKRKAHLSSMIVSGQMTRDEALCELAEPLYDHGMMEDYIRVIKERLTISDAEFNAIMEAQPRQHDYYKVEDTTVSFRVLNYLYWKLKR